uniref:Uncharacterized protein n=1 Tax=Ixodes ricinus TaxID=34613 RepID=A0A6B0U813_IXORI
MAACVFGTFATFDTLSPSLLVRFSFLPTLTQASDTHLERAFAGGCCWLLRRFCCVTKAKMPRKKVHPVFIIMGLPQFLPIVIVRP